jgi:hypothetical protein
VGTGFRQRSRTNKKLERDDDSTKNHPVVSDVRIISQHPLLRTSETKGTLASHDSSVALHLTFL